MVIIQLNSDNMEFLDANQAVSTQLKGSGKKISNEYK